jgi:hypothetical protein
LFFIVLLFSYNFFNIFDFFVYRQFNLGSIMQIQNAIKLSASGFLCSLLVACANMDVKKTYETDVVGLAKPSTVLIYDFSIDPSAIQQNANPISKMMRDDENEAVDKNKLATEVTDAMSKELVKKITALGLNPIRADQNTSLSDGVITIHGKLIKIDEGNSLTRNAIGLGVGKSSLDAKVLVYDHSTTGDKELMAFDAHADSGKKPGAVVMGPAGAAAGAGAAATVGANVAKGAADAYKSASAHQAEDMAEEITAELAKFFAKQGWINPNLAK